MTSEQRAKVISYAAGLMFKQAIQQQDAMRLMCLRKTYIVKYGDRLEVQKAHARIHGMLNAGIERHDAASRVEYAIMHHVTEECPPTDRTASQ